MRSSFSSLRSVLLLAIGSGSIACGGTTSAGDPVDAGTASPPPDATVASDGGTGGPPDAASDGALPDGGVAMPTSCKGPTAIVVAGKDTGFEKCSNGTTRRREVKDCPEAAPRAGFTCPSASDAGLTGACTSDSQCNAKPHGFCEPGIQLPGCFCNYGCVKDSDCAAGQVCDCRDPVGQCVSATCTSPASCGGADCVAYDNTGGCGAVTYACQTKSDTCYGDADCVDAGPGHCMVDNATGVRSCKPMSCAIGRPFTVDGAARTAATVARADWHTAAPTQRTPSAGARRELADHWTAVAEAEHASIASFARFVMELLAHGAPPHLLQGAQAAIADEIEHAKIAFGLASVYGGAAVGPSPLSMAGALTATTLEELALRTLREGCIGETLGALEAREAAARTDDASLRRTLEGIAEDEARHAALAWATVTWAVGQGVSVERITREAATALAELMPTFIAAGRSAGLEPLGVLSRDAREALARQVDRELIGPCLEALRHVAPKNA